MNPWKGVVESHRLLLTPVFLLLFAFQHDLHLSELLIQTLLMERPRLRTTAAAARGAPDGDDGETQLAGTEWKEQESHSRQGHATHVCVSAFAFHIPHGLQSPSEHGGCQLVADETINLWRCGSAFFHPLH